MLDSNVRVHQWVLVMALIINHREFFSSDLLVAVRSIRVRVIHSVTERADTGTISFVHDQISRYRMKGVVAEL